MAFVPGCVPAPDGQSSRPGVSRAVTGSRLDREDSRTPGVSDTGTIRPNSQNQVPVVQLSQRSRGGAVARRLRGRTDDRTSDAAQPAAPSSPRDRGGRGPRRRRDLWIDADRRPPHRRRTYVRRIGRRGDRDAVADRRPVEVSGRRRSASLRLIDWYQRARHGHPSPCRFTPSCSEYAREAFETYGTSRGLWLTIRRLLRCRPFGPSGYDPVPLPRTLAPPHG
jgi:putative membrane protein insertion efficiency factor